MRIRLLDGWYVGIFWWGFSREATVMLRRSYERGELVMWMLVLWIFEIRFFVPSEEDIEEWSMSLEEQKKRHDARELEGVK